MKARYIPIDYDDWPPPVAGSTYSHDVLLDANVDNELSEQDEILGLTGIKLWAGDTVAATASRYLKGPDNVLMNASLGYRPVRAGSIVRVTCVFNVTIRTVNTTIGIEVRKNGANVFSTTTIVTSTGIKSIQLLQLPGIDTFTNLDKLQLYMSHSSANVTITGVLASMELVYTS